MVVTASGKHLGLEGSIATVTWREVKLASYTCCGLRDASREADDLTIPVLSLNSFKRASLQVALSQKWCLVDSAHTTACISSIVTATGLQL